MVSRNLLSPLPTPSELWEEQSGPRGWPISGSQSWSQGPIGDAECGAGLPQELAEVVHGVGSLSTTCSVRKLREPQGSRR